MIVFAVSDKGGTGRSVTSSNVIYRLSLDGRDGCYVDLDLGSPTSGAIFGVDSLAAGTTSGRGVHAYLQGRVGEAQRCDLWSCSDRASLRSRPPGAGQLVLVPGDGGEGEFVKIDERMVDRCRRLLQQLQEEFAVTVVDLSAGRSFAARLVLAATAGGAVPEAQCRWLVFHRWTMQHLTAAHGLVHGERGLLDTGRSLGHDRDSLVERLRFVRTAVVDPNTADLSGLTFPQLSWLRERHHDLQQRAGELQLGRTMVLASIPMDPILQWHEQLLTDRDLFHRRIADPATVEAFQQLADKLLDPGAWERL